MKTTNRIIVNPYEGNVVKLGEVNFNEAKKEIIKIIRDEQNMLCTDSEIAEKILVAVLRIYGNNK
jgi:hypothetical protein